MMRSGRKLPNLLRPVVWDYDFGRLRWENDQDLIIGRVLMAGSWPMIGWLRERMGDDALRAWIMRRKGRGLTPRQIRFWQVLLELPSDQVSDWLKATRQNPWNGRISR